MGNFRRNEFFKIKHNEEFNKFDGYGSYESDEVPKASQGDHLPGIKLTYLRVNRKQGTDYDIFILGSEENGPVRSFFYSKQDKQIWVNYNVNTPYFGVLMALEELFQRIDLEDSYKKNADKIEMILKVHGISRPDEETGFSPFEGKVP